MGWFMLGSAIQRYHASSSPRYLRVGPGGISLCVPDTGFAATMLFLTRMWQFDLAWEQVRTWYPYTLSINLIPAEQQQIADAIQSARRRQLQPEGAPPPRTDAHVLADLPVGLLLAVTGQARELRELDY